MKDYDSKKPSKLITYLDMNNLYDWGLSECLPYGEFKACVRYFHQIFIFSPNDSSSKTMKNTFYFIKKGLFILEIFNFVFLSFSFFLPVGHCFRGWSEINLKVHDAINCLDKNSKTHVISWEGKKVCIVHRWSIR